VYVEQRHKLLGRESQSLPRVTAPARKCALSGETLRTTDGALSVAAMIVTAKECQISIGSIWPQWRTALRCASNLERYGKHSPSDDFVSIFAWEHTLVIEAFGRRLSRIQETVREEILLQSRGNNLMSVFIEVNVPLEIGGPFGVGAPHTIH